MNTVEFDFKGPVEAIIINHDSHAYTKIRYDKRTLDSLEQNMSKIDDFVCRSIVWRHLWIHVLDCKMSSIQYFNFVAKQLPLEQVEQTIVFTLTNLKSLIAYYIPSQVVPEYKAKMFPILH